MPPKPKERELTILKPPEPPKTEKLVTDSKPP
jgi:hypothetical protein